MVKNKIIIIFILNGEKQDHNYFYIAFDRGAWAKGVQLNKEFIFYDEEHSIFEREKDGSIIPTGDIVLTKNVEAYDFFQLIDTYYLGRYIIVNEKIKEKVEASEIKGVKVIPLNDAFKTHCKDYRVSISDLLAEVKKDKLKLKKDKLKFK